jgi:hypothetical protein
MNDVLGRIIDNTKDTILIRTFHFVSKYWHARVERRLALLGGRPHINIRAIYEYNMFIILSQRAQIKYPVLSWAHKRLFDHHPKCLLHCEFYRGNGGKNILYYASTYEECKAMHGGGYCNKIALHRENNFMFMIIFDYHDSIIHSKEDLFHSNLWRC